MFDNTITWNAQQAQALSNVNDWLNDPSAPQVYRLFGYAGTGKTTLAKHLVQDVSGHVLFGAYTGKAAYVLRQKGCPTATTVHSMIYKPFDKSHVKLLALQAKLEDTPDLPEFAEKRKGIEHEIAKEKKRLKSPGFQFNELSEVRSAKLVVLDEVSMIGDQMARDLLSFKTKVLVLGDPGQLPPVHGQGYFMGGKESPYSLEPDTMLTDVRRQEKDSPIIQLATMIRDGKRPPVGNYGDSRVMKRGVMFDDMLHNSDQILCGMNKTRHGYNRQAREIYGMDAAGPVVGDRVLCLQNNHDLGIYNGAVYDIADIDREQSDEDRITMTVRDEFDDRLVNTFSHMAYFKGDEPEPYERREADHFDYGYALTCHKSQGSQWDRVAIKDESWCFKRNGNHHKWLYTAVTRAAKSVDIVID